MFLLAITMFNTMVLAIPQPTPPSDPINANGLLTITKPPGPVVEGCTDYWAESNSRCSGDLRIYDQCIRKLTTGVWEQRTEDCSAYPDGYCMSGVCYTSADEAQPPISPQMMWYLKLFTYAGIFAVVGGLIMKRFGN